MSATGNEKTPAATPADQDRQPGSNGDAGITPPKEPEADQSAGGDPLIEGP